MVSRVVFTPSAPVTSPTTKVGGQPVWLSAPTWPLSASTGEPMSFVGQFELPGRVAYLFMTSSDEFVDGTYEPEGGENAFFCQPGPLPSFLRFSSVATGPTHSARDYTVAEGESESDIGSRVGGSPSWLQNPEVPYGASEFIAQLDSCDLPFEINFGDAGIGYAFVSPSGEGRFLWQCC
ncbi:hypothetical protein Lesp02_54670 [Lentzea sp. NBRC 105346]|uniref:hypothetical protein n=1 Tax=Lentzea sp. NBRC 105346 TaxID=3032205 RepID=UPI0024A3B6A8|nr:hypothetical protein [Lentzea sp. NBRC 105346]GLZ33279.1 hypothetical protein Lesp02_54670 [Lentzea sp. NBRC 105346]